jgi:hypothetical protein
MRDPPCDTITMNKLGTFQLFSRLRLLHVQHNGSHRKCTKAGANNVGKEKWICFEPPVVPTWHSGIDERALQESRRELGSRGSPSPVPLLSNRSLPWASSDVSAIPIIPFEIPKRDRKTRASVKLWAIPKRIENIPDSARDTYKTVVRP